MATAPKNTICLWYDGTALDGEEVRAAALGLVADPRADVDAFADDGVPFVAVGLTGMQDPGHVRAADRCRDERGDRVPSARVVEGRAVLRGVAIERLRLRFLL